MSEVYIWCAERNHPRNQVLFVFEDGDDDKGALMNRVRRDFGIELRFGQKIRDTAVRNELPMLPLQAADLAAWNVRRLMDAYAKDRYLPRSRIRYDFEELFSRIPYEGYHRHFAMVAATPVTPRVGEFSVMKQSLGIPSLVRFCVENGIPSR